MTRSWEIIQGCCLEVLKRMEADSVHCVVTSPPYFALRSYLPAGHADKAKEIGSEPTPEAFTATMVAVFEEVRRVLRPDGVLWLNLGDSYAGSAGSGNRQGLNGSTLLGSRTHGRGCAPEAAFVDVVHGLKPKDLIGIPWRVAFALQSAGWWLRSDVPWVKRSAMPESVTDRPAKALEYVFLLSKSASYYFDMEGVKKELATLPHAPGNKKLDASRNDFDQMEKVWGNDSGRNFRNADLWFDSIATPHGLCGIDDELVGLDVTSEALKEAHFAAYPCRLVEPLIKAGTSEKGCCPHCGAPWRRVVEKKRAATRPGEDSKVRKLSVQLADSNQPGVRCSTLVGVVGNRDPERHCTTTATLGWQQTCKCPAHEPIPCTVLDPFCGAATTGLVALRLGRRFIGIELNPVYVELGTKRLINDNPLFNTQGD